MNPLFLADHLTDIRTAAERISGRVLRTPTLAPLDFAGVLLKPECLQPTGSFKVRGAFNALLELHAASPDLAGVVTVSSGNHGQALAYAGRNLGVPVVVVMPASAAPVKVAAVTRLGARVVSDGVTPENREECFRAVVEETGFAPVHPFDNWSVIHGQATIGLEILADQPEVATIVVPVSGAGLLSGVAMAAKALRPDVRVVGAEPAAADDARQSLAAGRVVRQIAGPTIADGALAPEIGARPAEVLLEQGLVDAIVTVSDDELREALPRLWMGAKLLAEPTGGLAVAAGLRGGLGMPVVAVVTGGNVDPALVAALLAPDRGAPPRR
ncbi:MAG TPA: threonine/serine dehydratase [Mycobacteriales bacterium]|nr:threonine/serine dehydratase [Mycobacteriales bacterium]